MRILLVLLLNLFCLYSFAQKNPYHLKRANVKKQSHPPVVTKGFYLSFNPNSIFEPDQGAIGMGFGYRFSNRVEAFMELDYLYHGFYDNSRNYGSQHFNNLEGFRSIGNLKYFYRNRHGFFTGIEFRIKRYSFNSKNNFENIQSGDTLIQYPYKATHTLTGAGLFWGNVLILLLTVNLKWNAVLVSGLKTEVSIGASLQAIVKFIPAGLMVLHHRIQILKEQPLTFPEL